MELQFTVSELITIGAMVVSITIVVITNKNNSKYINKKIDALEKKQDKHNNLIERTFRVEESNKVAHNRITSLENDIKEEIRELRSKIDQVLEKLTEHIIGDRKKEE